MRERKRERKRERERERDLHSIVLLSLEGIKLEVKVTRHAVGTAHLSLLCVSVLNIINSFLFQYPFDVFIFQVRNTMLKWREGEKEREREREGERGRERDR